MVHTAIAPVVSGCRICNVDRFEVLSVLDVQGIHQSLSLRTVVAELDVFGVSMRFCDPATIEACSRPAVEVVREEGFCTIARRSGEIILIKASTIYSDLVHRIASGSAGESDEGVAASQ